MVYMLHLITCIVFVDKSGVYIDAMYACLFSNLKVTSWVYGCATLTILYTTLGVATVFETIQLAGYLSLLHVSYPKIPPPSPFSFFSSDF